jgi:hypothetical protein
MTEPLNDEEPAAIQKRFNEATLGPWKSYVEGRDHTSGSSFIMTGPPNSRGPDIELLGATVARTSLPMRGQDLPRLLDEIVRLQKLMDGRDKPGQDVEG